MLISMVRSNAFRMVFIFCVGFSGFGFERVLLTMCGGLRTAHGFLVRGVARTEF